MVAFDANEALTPYRTDRGYGAILFDRQRLRQAGAELFSPAAWGERARPVDSGGRGGAWFVDAPFGACVLRHYLRGGLAARLSRDRYLWRGVARTRSFAEFRLMRELLGRGLPVPRPLAASYVREGLRYRAAILLERLEGVRSLADRALVAGSGAPWEEAGRLIARFHREGLDHADLNAHNLLFDGNGRGWLIDFDRGRMRIPATGWREGNLRRLHRSLLKLRGGRSRDEVERDFARLRRAYELAWKRGC
ncbi:3-deoxy-D-manno-octulosonic acid kinase [Pseudoxanthomonas broegbernensis]|uniref:3-deoxy-D-manno-octulosonic acid kinase n=1 Tax=Pseudoxanthomonas broegbernensis TaxID=83619 RepID=A0A7V8GP11_9GAMM|nr:3-deoxy-D-manno-octulosonic acid kinase [Pseudoxanthomonas broegbernensis]KAF1687501.1 3-deoxy-D-manno-octulosonic acid kinase [Pseudoxanthomonas broegbernensis]MBB6064505.1 3-deoxy-D-manno-octulosonic acid kinase [Pseudoxanthomonas broegbernensis]